ncbi:hypothetical protein FNW52_06055 [Flavobacterium sp. ZT3R18]|uniref:hypothetical protein n=1 Tax=Flavobacterium sp. ZT3R18 TaxID=2594429 RepID=UPI00117B8CF3|nr:hypothetical protein [Flavobacterium sp. ZT3R18]TRX36800.1 hypothetical protein FNW52_06055 [Flavobacterium sp. ZT3R18]
MTTLNINERTKAGKVVLELVKILTDAGSKGITIDAGLGKPVTKELSLKEKKYLNNLKKVAEDIRENIGKKQYQSAQSFLDEL